MQNIDSTAVRAAELVNAEIDAGMSKIDLTAEAAKYPTMSNDDLTEQYREFVTDDAIFRQLDNDKTLTLDRLLEALGV